MVKHRGIGNKFISILHYCMIHFNITNEGNLSLANYSIKRARDTARYNCLFIS